VTTRDELDLSGTRWRKSRRSNNTGGDCVESACAADARAVRDSKNPSGPVLMFKSDAFANFLAGLRAGQFVG
jgi:hypothetical protein